MAALSFWLSATLAAASLLLLDAQNLQHVDYEGSGRNLDEQTAPSTSLRHITPFKQKYLKRLNGTVSVLLVFYNPDLPVSKAR
jgi:hypothetical protein